MPDEDPSVLGNLPRSRPGRRSDKRAAASKPKQQPKATRPRAAAKTQARRPASSKPRPRTAASSASSRPAAARSQPTDPVSGAIRLAGQVASAGVGAGLKVAGEVLKRLPGR